jgi:hypothetical protein
MNIYPRARFGLYIDLKSTSSTVPSRNNQPVLLTLGFSYTDYGLLPKPPQDAPWSQIAPNPRSTKPEPQTNKPNQPNQLIYGH